MYRRAPNSGMEIGSASGWLQVTENEQKAMQEEE